MNKVSGFKDQQLENIIEAMEQGLYLDDKVSYSSVSGSFFARPRVSARLKKEGRSTPNPLDTTSKNSKPKYKSTSENLTPGTSQYNEIMRTVELNRARSQKRALRRRGNDRRSERTDDYEDD